MKRLTGMLALLILAIVPAVAMAHEGNPDFRSEINFVDPERLGEGLSITVVNFDDHVRIENESGKEILVLGYDDEPYGRMSPDGTVEINLNSPSHYLNEDRFADIEMPERADKDAEPDWEQIGENGIFEWHDHRSHYMTKGTPPQVEDESERTKVFDYTIPMEVGGEPATIHGTLFWAGRDSDVPVIPFVILALVVIATIGFWVKRRRDDSDAEPEANDRSGTEEQEEREAW